MSEFESPEDVLSDLGFNKKEIGKIKKEKNIVCIERGNKMINKTELKTLKDMDLTCQDLCPNICNSIGIIRGEAIKHIKHWKEEIKKADEYCTPEEDTDLFGMIKAFEDFFNITEEDLE